MNAHDRVRAQLLAGIAARPARTRAEGRRRALVGYALAALAMAVLFQAAGGFAHGAARPLDVTLRLVAGSTAMALAAVVLGLGRGRSMTGRANGTLLAVTLAIPVLAFLWQTHWFGLYAEPSQRFGWRCIALTLAMGGALLGAVLTLRRGTATSNAALGGATVGAVAGACATVLVDAWCPLANATHVLQGHILPIAALTMVGALLGRAYLGVRAR